MWLELITLVGCTKDMDGDVIPLSSFLVLWVAISLIIIIFSCFVSFYVLFLEVVDKVHSLHYCSDYIYKQVQRNQCFGQKKYWKMFC